MRFTELLFGKPDVKLVDEEDLHERIISRMKTGNLESSFVEFKSFRGITSLKKEIRKVTRNIVALANSVERGGLLILGVDEKKCELTPFPINLEKDGIDQKIKSMLLVEKPEKLTIQVIHSGLKKFYGYVIIEVDVIESNPFYWGYKPETGENPFVKKTESGVIDIPTTEIHKPQGYDLQVDYDQHQITLLPQFCYRSDGQFSSYHIPLSLEIKNISLHPISNLQIICKLNSAFLTDRDELLWMNDSENILEKQKKPLRLIKEIESGFSHPFSVQYQEYDGTFGDQIEICFSDKHDLAQNQSRRFSITLNLTNVRHLTPKTVPLLLIASSNEMGEKIFNLLYNFIRYK